MRLLYQEYIQDFDREKIPTLLQFQRVLEAQPEREAREIALAFEIYTKGSLDVPPKAFTSGEYSRSGSIIRISSSVFKKTLLISLFAEKRSCYFKS